MLKRYFTYQVQQTIFILTLTFSPLTFGPTSDKQAEIKPEAKRVAIYYDEYAEQRDAKAAARH